MSSLQEVSNPSFTAPLKTTRSRKGIVFAAFFLFPAFVIALILGSHEGVWYAPELFGIEFANAHYVAIPGAMLGLVKSSMGTWLLVSRGAGCSLQQVGGAKVSNYGTPGAIPCRMAWKGDRFRGWIFFRTHERPFCGAPTANNLPTSCQLR